MPAPMRPIRRAAVCGLLCAGLLAAAPALAGDDAELAIRSALIAQKDKRVYLRLGAGEELSGKVAAVDEHSVTLAELAGREYFNATVRLDRIDAVIVRVK